MNSINNVNSNSVAFNGWGQKMKSLFSKKGVTAVKEIVKAKPDVNTGGVNPAIPAAVALASLGVAQKAKEKVLTPLEQAKKDNFELYNALMSQGHEYTYGRDDDYTAYTRHYCDSAIVTIIKYNKEDPDFAYELSKYLEHNSNNRINELTIEQTELIAQTLKNEPEFMENIKDYAPHAKAWVLEVRTQAPDMVDIMVENDSIKCLFDDHQRVKDAIEEFEKHKEPMTEIMNTITCDFKDILDILPSYIEDKEKATKLISLLTENFDIIPYCYKELFEYYKQYPEHTTNAIEAAREQGELYFTRIVPIIQEERKYENAIAVAKESNLIPVLKKAGEMNRDTWYSMIDNFQSCPEVLDRIIEDGRFPQALELKDLYLQNPDKAVTDKMVAKYLDPIGKFFK